MTRDQIFILSKGLKFIPTPVTKHRHISFELLKDFNAFARRMCLQYIFHGQDNEPHPFHLKSNWEPTVQLSVALETYLEEAKIQVEEIKIVTPRNNLLESEALRLLRTDSSKTTFEENINNFKRKLRERGYPDNLLLIENTLSDRTLNIAKDCRPYKRSRKRTSEYYHW